MSQGESWVYFKKKGVLWETFEDLEIILCSENCTQCPETCPIFAAPSPLHPSSSPSALQPGMYNHPSGPSRLSIVRTLSSCAPGEKVPAEQ